MSYYNNQQAPFWDYVRAFSNQGAGVDRPAPSQPFGPPPNAQYAGFPFAGLDFSRGARGFGPGHFGRGGRRGACRREHSREGPHAPPGGSENEEHPEGEAGEEVPHGHRSGFGRHGGRGGGHRHRYRGPPPSNGMGGFDLSALIESLSDHPLAQTFRQFAEQAAGQSGETLAPEYTDDDNSFNPPVDVFTTETQFVIHVALPGAKKEDVGINWDVEKGVLNLAGVVYRPGDEEFLKTLTASERKVGAFERAIKLPPGNAEKEEIDGDAITAKLEDGVLVVTVPKVEKEWTEVKRVDIE